MSKRFWLCVAVGVFYTIVTIHLLEELVEYTVDAIYDSASS